MVERPQSEAGTRHLPNLESLELDLATSPGARSAPGWSPRSVSVPAGRNVYSPASSSVASPRTASLNSLAFEPMAPQLSVSSVASARSAIEDAEGELVSLQAARELMHVESTEWAALDDHRFADTMGDGHRRLTQLDYESVAVQQRLVHKRDVAKATEAAMGAQVESAKRAKLFERRKAETREANLREAGALAGLADAKSTEFALKQALLRVGQYP